LAARTCGRVTGPPAGRLETQMQADMLRAQGWECGQGYYFGRPAAAPAGIRIIEDELIA